MNEQLQNVSQEAGQNNSSGESELSTHQGMNSACISTATGISELEQMLKRMSFTRYETQHLISLLQSRTTEDSPSDNFRSKVVEEQIASPASPVNAGQTSRRDSKLINNNATCLSKTPMTSPHHPTNMENLPDDLLVNILTRLFAKQLAQMRSISKSWNAFLSQSSFIKSHIHRSIRHNDKILLHFPNGEPSVAFEVLVNRHLQLDNFIKLPVNPQPKYYDIRVIGAVNGLICSSYNDSFIQIWNPSLSAMITLPPYSMPPYYVPPYSIPSDGYDWIKVYFRFGFDPKADDYKVVKLTAFANESAHVVTWWMDVEIYSMRKGEWELITKKFPSHIAWIDENEAVCADGHDGRLHWLCSTTKEIDPNTIMAFDLGSETFREIPLPHVIVAYEYHCSKSLGVLAGKLCLMSWDGSAPCEVWVMDEYGVVDSWVKRHVFSQFTGDTYPFGFTPSNKYLIQDQYCRLVLYNPFTEEAQILKNDCSYEEYDAGKMVEYVDSLVWVAPVKRKRKMVDGVQLIRN